MTATEGAVPLPAVIGKNARRLRGTATADDVARAARLYGLNWGTGRISDLEHGRVSPTLPTLVALALAFSEVRYPGPAITLADLVRCDENIALTTGLDVTADELMGFLGGGGVTLGHRHAQQIRDGFDALISGDFRKGWPDRLAKVPSGAIMRVSVKCGLTEQRLARDLGLDASRLAAEMAYLWKRPFSAERDERAGPVANAQKKGRVARELKAELKAVLDGDG